MSTLLDAVPLRQPLLPRLKMRELIDIDPGPTSSSNPPPQRDIRNRQMVANQVPGRGLFTSEMLVEDGVQPASFVGVACFAVGDVFGGVAYEMVRLALHGTDAGVLVEEPVVDLVGFAGPRGVGDAVRGRVVLLNEVLEDTAGFEQADLLPVCEGVC